MDKQEIARKIIEVARMIAETNDRTEVFICAGRLEVLFEQLDALPVETPEPLPTYSTRNPRMMICNGTNECKYYGGCFHKLSHEHRGLACTASCCAFDNGGVRGAHCIPVEEVPA